MTAKGQDSKLSLRLPTDLLERAERLAARLQREAEGERVTASSVLRRALRRGIDELERETRTRQV